MLGSGSPSQLSSSCNQDTAPSSMAAAPYALVTSSFQSVRSSATEQGRLLAQRSRTSLNRFLDSVLDNATTVAESNTAHESYSEHGSTASQTKTYASDMKSTRPQLQQQPTSKLKFFVCDESEDDNDDDDDDESEDGRLAVMAIRRSKPATNLIRQADAHDFHYKDYDSQDCEAEDSQDEEGDSFCGHMFIATPTSQTPRSGITQLIVIIIIIIIIISSSSSILNATALRGVRLRNNRS
ncbi:hypothetical protein BGZ75_007352 [Mortierella antarctica]|nr:hypothetical protein BGZ75_007352 [Mortierella antarctica]